MQIAQQKVVTLNYTLTDDQGVIIDRSESGDFAYLHGAASIIPGLERALEGKSAGDKFTVAIAPVDAYGERDESLTQVVPRSAFGEAEPNPGDQFHAQSGEGQMIVITITQVDGDRITIDGNHPLAGVNLNFEVEVIEVRDASSEELSHGHVHGPDGHHHD